MKRKWIHWVFVGDEANPFIVGTYTHTHTYALHLCKYIFFSLFGQIRLKALSQFSQLFGSVRCFGIEYLQRSHSFPQFKTVKYLLNSPKSRVKTIKIVFQFPICSIIKRTTWNIAGCNFTIRSIRFKCITRTYKNHQIRASIQREKKKCAVKKPHQQININHRFSWLSIGLNYSLHIVHVLCEWCVR